MRRSETGQHERFKCSRFKPPSLSFRLPKLSSRFVTISERRELAAYREITLAAKGLEIAHLQFVFRAQTLAVCSRVRRDGLVEIELGLGDPRLPKSAITSAQMRDAEASARARAGTARHSRTSIRMR